MKIKPLADRVVVKMIEAKTHSGIVLPGSAKEKLGCRVKAVGRYGRGKNAG